MMDQQTFEAATQNFNLPHDIVTLPTGGIFYKSKKKSVKVGYLTAADENLLISAASNAKDNIVASLLRNKIYEHDLRPEEMLDADIEAILIFLRNSSFGYEYNFNLVDPKTDKPFKTTILLDELNIKRGSVIPDENGLLTTTLPRTGVTVKAKPTNLGDSLEIEKLAEQYPNGLTPPRITWRLNRQIQELDGSTDKSVIAKFIEQMPISDSKYLRKFIKDNVPSLDLTKKIVAPSGELVTTEITFGVEFFRPFF